jgi:ATP-binding cassette subfamily B protein
MSHSTPSRLLRARSYFSAFAVARREYPGFARHFGLACLLVGGVALLNSATPYLLRLAIDAIGQGSRQGASTSVLAFAGGYGVCWSAAASMEWVRSAAAASMLARCEGAFRQAFHARFLRAQYAELLRLDPGTLLSQCNRCATAFGSLTYTLFWAVMPTVIQWVLACVVLARVIDPRYAVVFGALMLVVFGGTIVLTRRTRNAHATIAQAADRLGSYFTERVGFVFDVKMNAAVEREEAGSRRFLREYANDLSQGNVRLAMLLAAQALLAGASLTALTVAAAVLALRGGLSAGDFAMVAGYVVALTSPFTVLASTLSDFKRNEINLRDGLRILDLPEEPDNGPVDFDEASERAVEVCDLALSLNGARVLKGVDLVAWRGQLTLLVGPSGGGKSTLALAMLGMLSPEQGRVRILGHDVTGLGSRTVIRAVGAVPQSPLMIAGTVAENLAYGCAHAPSLEDLRQVARDLELDDLGGEPRDVDMALQRHVGVLGREISGGQRQRIAIGRALLRRPRILFLDEATSAIAPEQAERIMPRIRRRVPTMVAIAHGTAGYGDADKVYMIDKGLAFESPARPPRGASSPTR